MLGLAPLFLLSYNTPKGKRLSDGITEAIPLLTLPPWGGQLLHKS